MSVAPTTRYITVAAATGTVTINATDLFSRYVVETSGSVSLAANLTFSLSGTPFEGQTICFDLPGTITNGAFTFTILGQSIPAYLSLKKVRVYFRWSAGAGAWYSFVQTAALQSDSIDGTELLDNSVALDKLSGAGTNEIVATDGSGVLQYIPIGSQEIPINNGTNIVGAQASGTSEITWSAVSDQLTFTIANNVITNAKVAAAAAIARTKLASGTANHVLINDGSGVMSSEAALNVSRGGTGLDNSAATGLQKYAAGTPSVGLLVAADVTADTLTPSTLTQEARTEVLNFTVSFEAGEQCDNKILMPYAGSVVTIYATVVKAIAATDSATITPKNQGGTTMTSGVVTFSASAALNTAQTTTPTANNTFVAGDVLSFTTAKTTAGGRALISVVVERS
jgi:hypothetical protein